MTLTIIYDAFRYTHETAASFDWFKRHVLPEGNELKITWKTHLTCDQVKADKILLLGPKTLEKFTGSADIFKARGNQVNSYKLQGLTLATFHPQDAWEFKTGTDSTDETSEKDFGRTAPANYLFWCKADSRKLLEPPIKHPPFNFTAYPNIRDCIRELSSIREQRLYLDIETRYIDQALNCIGYAINEGPVRVVPFYGPDNRAAYDQLYLMRFLVALSRAMQGNTTIIHNSSFDLGILAAKYRIPFGKRIFDTMLATHRMYPEIEKSLGHTISLWTWLPFHKDQGGEPHNTAQLSRYWRYNALDVYAMREVHKAQLNEMSRNPGYKLSVEQVNRSIPNYLLISLQGLNVDELALASTKWSLLRRLIQYKRIVDVLVGRKFNAASSQQCVSFFHKQLGYSVIAYSDSGAPSLDQKALYKLRLKYPNPLIDMIIAYRILFKAHSMLSFASYPGVGNI